MYHDNAFRVLGRLGWDACAWFRLLLGERPLRSPSLIASIRSSRGNKLECTSKRAKTPQACVVVIWWKALNSLAATGQVSVPVFRAFARGQAWGWTPAQSTAHVSPQLIAETLEGFGVCVEVKSFALGASQGRHEGLRSYSGLYCPTRGVESGWVC